MRRIVRFLLCLCLCLSGLAGRTWALDVPPLTARVNDLAGVLAPATERALEDNLAALEASDSTQLAVLTIPSLEGEALEDFSLKAAETWGIGQKGRDNGALLLVAVADRAVRIEVGYGLEDRLTDLLCGRIIRHEIVPAFREGDFDQGVLKGVAAMTAAVQGAYAASPDDERPDPAELLTFLGMSAWAMGGIFRRKQLWAALGGAAAGLGCGLLFPGTFPFWLCGIIGALGAFFVATAMIANPNRGVTIRRHPGGFGGYSGGGSFGGGFDGFGGGGGGFGGGGASGRW